MKRLFLSVFAFIFCQILVGQVYTPVDTTAGPNLPDILENLQVNNDPRLEKMLSWHITKNTRINGIEGFRIEIFFSSDYDALEMAKKKKVEFLSLFPDNAVHIKYVAPNFRVRVGDFRTKNEALKLYKKIKKDYPVAFIVTDNIDFPLLKQEPYERAY